MQPPSCGCVLKQIKLRDAKYCALRAAAFVRLCVETQKTITSGQISRAAAFVRLCVETASKKKPVRNALAAAFVRLCVETCVCVCIITSD